MRGNSLAFSRLMNAYDVSISEGTGFVSVKFRELETNPQALAPLPPPNFNPVPPQTVGVVLDVRRTYSAASDFYGGVNAGGEAYELYKEGLLQHSFGFKVLKGADRKGFYEIQEVKIFEVSSVVLEVV